MRSGGAAQHLTEQGDPSPCDPPQPPFVKTQLQSHLNLCSSTGAGGAAAAAPPPPLMAAMNVEQHTVMQGDPSSFSGAQAAEDAQVQLHLSLVPREVCESFICKADTPVRAMVIKRASMLVSRFLEKLLSIVYEGV